MLTLCNCSALQSSSPFLSEEQWLFAVVTGLVATGLTWAYLNLPLRWRHFRPFFKHAYVRTDIFEYHLAEQAEWTPTQHEKAAEELRTLRSDCCFGTIKMRRRGGDRSVQVVADYRSWRGQVRGLLDFSSSRWIGKGSFRYLTGHQGWGEYTMYLRPEVSRQIRVVFVGTMPTDKVRGYEIWTRIDQAVAADFPEHLREDFDKQIAQARGEALQLPEP